MSHGEKGDELPSQVIYLRGRESHVSENQFGADFFCVAMPQEKCSSDEDHHIIGDIAAMWHNSKKIVRIKDAGTLRAVKQCFMGDKGARQAEHRLLSGLLYNKVSATETTFSVWDEANDRGFRK